LALATDPNDEKEEHIMTTEKEGFFCEFQLNPDCQLVENTKIHRNRLNRLI